MPAIILFMNQMEVNVVSHYTNLVVSTRVGASVFPSKTNIISLDIKKNNVITNHKINVILCREIPGCKIDNKKMTD